jgi:putative transposase
MENFINLPESHKLMRWVSLCLTFIILVTITGDGLPSYDKAFQKEFYTLKNPRVKNIRSISVRNEGLNSVVERLNGTVRDREKVMRGMNTKESAQKVIEAMRIHYNYVREHSKLGKTPAEECGIKIVGKNKLLTLIQNAK